MTLGDRPKNRLLAALPVQDWERLRPHFDEVDLPLGQLLCEGGAPFDRLYFPTAGVISTVAVFADGSAAEMATTGREGMVGVGAILGSDTSLSRQLVQVPGSALVIDYDTFRQVEPDMPSLRVALFAYTQAFMAQVLQSVACNGVHTVEERVARWLLMCHDRSDADQFLLTQEFLAEMLGVSRRAVSMVARTLQRAGLIRYSRGVITIEDRARLEAASCECYGAIRQQYEDRLFRVLVQNGHGPIGKAGQAGR
jgi:CRP-like cAMP-binding protein